MVATMPEPLAERYRPGAIVAGSYQLLQRAGDVATGSVWRAKNRTLDLEVVLHLVAGEIENAADGSRGRVQRQARAAANLVHPGILQVLDFGFTEHRDAYLVLEAPAGETLRDALGRKGAQSATRAVQILLPVLEALAFAHDRGIVHGDVKPENLFLARLAGQRLQPKLLNFGTTERASSGESEAARDVDGVVRLLCEMVSGDPTVGVAAIRDDELAAIARGGAGPDARALGRALAGWLLARGVRDDVCGAALKSWRHDAGAAEAPVHSFFPSNLPEPSRSLGPSQEGARDDADEAGGVVLRAPGALPVGAGAVLAGVRAMPAAGATPDAAAAPAESRRGRVHNEERRLLWITLLGVAAAFVGAALWSDQSRWVSSALSSVGLGPGDAAETDSVAGSGVDSGSASDSVDGAGGGGRELPFAGRRVAPLPKSGRNAPLLYVDAPARKAARAVSAEGASPAQTPRGSD